MISFEYYFAADGSYGNAENIFIVDTYEFTAYDWKRIEEATDDERHWVAREIARGL